MMYSEAIRELLTFADSYHSRTTELVREGVTLAIRRSITTKDTKATKGKKKKDRSSFVPSVSLGASP